MARHQDTNRKSEMGLVKKHLSRKSLPTKAALYYPDAPAVEIGD